MAATQPVVIPPGTFARLTSTPGGTQLRAHGSHVPRLTPMVAEPRHSGDACRPCLPDGQGR